MTKELKKLIKDLKEIKENGVWERDIPDIMNLLIDYDNETQMSTFDDFIYRFASYDSLMDAIRYHSDIGDLWGIQRITEGIEKSDRYTDNGDYFENITDAEVEERLNEIIDYAKSF